MIQRPVVVATLLTLVGSGLLFGQEATQPKDDAEAIQGAWSVASGGDLTGGTIVFIRSELKMQFPKNKDEFTGSFKLDPAKNPKQIDLHMKGGEPNRGIYVLDGDTLKIFAAPGPDRPTSCPKDSSPGVIILKRKK